MPQILVDAGRFQGLASTCCAFQTIIYAKGATGSHFILWCLLRWDIAGFKMESRVGITLTNLYTQQTWINFKTTKNVFQRITFILINVSSCWHLKHVSKWEADMVSNITPDQMYFELMLSIKVIERVAENLKQSSMVNSCLSKSPFTRKSSPLAWTLSLTRCQYIHILQASDFHSWYTPLTSARGRRALSEETWSWRACRNHLSRMSQDTSDSHIY